MNKVKVLEEYLESECFGSCEGFDITEKEDGVFDIDIYYSPTAMLGPEYAFEEVESALSSFAEFTIKKYNLDMI